MNLRAKTLLIVAITLISLIGILYVAANRVLMSGFSKVENESTIQNVKRVQDAFADDYNNISVKCSDWAMWDDMYKFIGDHNKEFIASNLQDNSISTLKLDYMFFVDSSNKFVFCRGYDPDKSTGFDPSAELKSFILSDSLITRHAKEDNVVAGMAIAPSGPILLASRPIVTSDGKGPIRGAVIFARDLDSAEICRIAQMTHLSLALRHTDSADLLPDMRSVQGAISETSPISTRPLSEDTIAGYAYMKDIHGKPILMGRVNVGRAIYKQGQATKIYLVFAICLAGLVFGMIILLLLERSVISRVATLSKDVNAIGESGDHSKRVRLGGKDELTNLASSMNQMLSTLQKNENLIRERNQQMRMIMNTVPSGLLSVDENFIVNPEYARSVENILGRPNLAGQDFFNLIGLTQERKNDRQKLFDFLDLYRQEILPEKDMAGLNPFEEINLASGPAFKWLRIRYYLIKRGEGAPKHFLVVVEDITQEKALAEKVRQSERENLQLKAIVEDPDLFKDFLIETRRILKHAEEKIGAMQTARDRKTIVNEVFRDVHTIKGTASSFGLSAVSEIAGGMEDSLSPLRETGDIRPEMIVQTRESLALLTKTVLDAVESAKRIMGDDFADDTDMHVKISLAKIKSESVAINKLLFRELIDKPTAENLNQKIETRLRSFRLVPARKGLAKALKIVPGLIARLQKKIIFDFEGADTLIDCEIARELTTPLVHMIRNAFDHGIEADPDERTAANKPPEGRVKLAVQAKDRSLVVSLADDGRGMDPEHLKKIALKKGVITPEEAKKLSREDLLGLIYRPGFSTASVVSEVSGRGVGMDAVLTTVKEKLGGRVSIASETGKGSSFTIEVSV